MNDPGSPGPQQHERWNEGMALAYDPDAFITKTGLVVRWVEALRLAWTRDLIACRPSDSVLDLGCGAGNLLERLDGARVVGLDLSDSLLEKARRRVQGRPGVEVVKGDAERLPFPASSFDRVVCSEVLEHVEDPARVIAEVRRVLKTGGRAVITLPNEDLINRTKRLVLALGLKRFVAGSYPMSDNMLHQWHRREVEAPELLELMRDGFEAEGSRGVPLPFFAYHRIFSFRAR